MRRPTSSCTIQALTCAGAAAVRTILCMSQGRDAAELLTTLYDRYVKQCVEYVLTGVIDGAQAEKLRQVHLQQLSLYALQHTQQLV